MTAVTPAPLLLGPRARRLRRRLTASCSRWRARRRRRLGRALGDRGGGGPGRPAGSERRRLGRRRRRATRAGGRAAGAAGRRRGPAGRELPASTAAVWRARLSQPRRPDPVRLRSALLCRLPQGGSGRGHRMMMVLADGKHFRAGSGAGNVWPCSSSTPPPGSGWAPWSAPTRPRSRSCAGCISSSGGSGSLTSCSWIAVRAFAPTTPPPLAIASCSAPLPIQSATARSKIQPDGADPGPARARQHRRCRR